MREFTTEQISREKEAYEMVDRFLRNNLSDMDYADYSQALDLLSTLSGQTAESGEAYSAVVEVCPECDIAGCIHIRARRPPSSELPAQAMGEKCVCGDPSALNVTHRIDGPCFHEDTHQDYHRLRGQPSYELVMDLVKSYGNEEHRQDDGKALYFLGQIEAAVAILAAAAPQKGEA